MCVCVQVWACACMHVCWWVHVFACMCVYVCASMSMHARVHVCVHVSVQVCMGEARALCTNTVHYNSLIQPLLPRCSAGTWSWVLQAALTSAGTAAREDVEQLPAAPGSWTRWARPWGPWGLAPAQPRPGGSSDSYACAEDGSSQTQVAEQKGQGRKGALNYMSGAAGVGTHFCPAVGQGRRTPGSRFLLTVSARAPACHDPSQPVGWQLIKEDLVPCQETKPPVGTWQKLLLITLMTGRSASWPRATSHTGCAGPWPVPGLSLPSPCQSD